MLAHPYLLDCKTACLEFRIGDPKETAAGADEHGRREDLTALPGVLLSFQCLGVGDQLEDMLIDQLGFSRGPLTLSIRYLL